MMIVKSVNGYLYVEEAANDTENLVKMIKFIGITIVKHFIIFMNTHTIDL